MGNRMILGMVFGVVLLVGVTGWVSTAPYLGNQGLSRTPGVIIGGTDTQAPSDFTALNDARSPLIMKLGGFPPFVVYLSYAGTPEGWDRRRMVALRRGDVSDACHRGLG